MVLLAELLVKRFPVMPGQILILLGLMLYSLQGCTTDHREALDRYRMLRRSSLAITRIA